MIIPTAQHTTRWSKKSGIFHRVHGIGLYNRRFGSKNARSASPRPLLLPHFGFLFASRQLELVP